MRRSTGGVLRTFHHRLRSRSLSIDSVTRVAKKLIASWTSSVRGERAFRNLCSPSSWRNLVMITFLFRFRPNLLRETPRALRHVGVDDALAVAGDPRAGDAG